MITFSLRISDAPNERLFPLSWCSFSTKLMKIAHVFLQSIHYTSKKCCEFLFAAGKNLSSTFNAPLIDRFAQSFVFQPLHLVFVKVRNFFI